MAGLDEALERLVTDQEFRNALERDPQSAMAGYDLTEGERAVLAAQLDPGTGVSGRVEQRTSKSGLLAGLMGSGGAGEVGPGDLAAPEQEPEEISLLLPAVQKASEAGAGAGESTGGELDQDTSNAPASHPEWKYVPVRRFDPPSDSDQNLASPSAVDASGNDVGIEDELGGP